MTTHLKFRIGNQWICVEDGSGHVADHPDSVTFAVRSARSSGRPGARSAVDPSVKRNAVLAIGLRLLELADRMTPETTWQDSQTVTVDGQPPAVFHRSADDRPAVERLLAGKPVDFARHVYARAELLRARMPVLRVAQRVLEHCNDDTAAGLYVLLAAADQTDGFPARPVVGFDPSGSGIDTGNAEAAGSGDDNDE